jgi:hypothetical protein
VRQGADPLLHARDGLVDAARDLRQACLERCAFRLFLRDQGVQALAEFDLDLAEAAAERADELLALPLERRSDLSELLLEPQPSGVA